MNAALTESISAAPVGIWSIDDLVSHQIIAPNGQQFDADGYRIAAKSP